LREGETDNPMGDGHHLGHAGVDRIEVVLTQAVEVELVQGDVGADVVPAGIGRVDFGSVAPPGRGEVGLGGGPVALQEGALSELEVLPVNLGNAEAGPPSPSAGRMVGPDQIKRKPRLSTNWSGCRRRYRSRWSPPRSYRNH
jgi:hypothetical protein